MLAAPASAVRPTGAAGGNLSTGVMENGPRISLSAFAPPLLSTACTEYS